MLWVVFGFMLLAAALSIAWPLYREEQKLTGRSVIAMVALLAVSVTIYSEIGEPEARAVVQETSNIDDMVDSLARRLESNGEDISGWKMLGRSYAELKRYREAATAFDRAVELEAYGNAQTLVDLGEALMMADGAALKGRASQLFENALALEPGNPKALFYGGVAAIDRGDVLVAADRWELLLATSPPPDIEDVLRQRIAEWRGTETTASLPQSEPTGPIELLINVQMDAAATQAIDPGATVFVIARDPEQPSPPVAVVRRKASELPFMVALNDGNSMIPGRTLSNFSKLELIVRASASGQPMAQSGDWFGSQIVDTASAQNFDIVISRQVP